ncbi:RecX family transcriptional regulator [Candidatus Kapabacteria bacterium]|nr:RecX family transcriptional regulator [Candidatus Kapabacteria bacterium]
MQNFIVNKISSLDKKYVDISFDNRESLILHIDIALKYSIVKGYTLDSTNITQMIYDSNLINAKSAALKFLNYKPRFQKELELKIIKLGFENRIVNEVIKFAKEYKLINDEELTVQYIKEKFKIKAWTNYRLINELSLKGVDKDFVKQNIDEIISPEKELERALQISEKKLLTIKNKPLIKQQSSISNLLQRNGYSYEIIRKILDALC